MFTSTLRAKWSFPHRNCTPLNRWQSLVWATRRSRPRRHTMLNSHQCPQTSAAIWHGARSQHHPEAHEGGALSSEAWLHLITCFFCGPPTGEASAPDGVEQVAPPGVVHIDVALAWRSEEAAVKDFSCKARKQRSQARVFRVTQTLQTASQR